MMHEGKDLSAPPIPPSDVQVSVVIPTFNGVRFITELLHSIASQTCLPDEVILSDDCSTDKTLEEIERFSRDAKFHVKILTHGRLGITKNYLNALSHSTGKIIFFADQDDVWEPSRIERYVEEFRRHPEASVVGSDSCFVDEVLAPMGSTLRGGELRSHRLSAQVNRGQDLTLFLRGRLPIAAHSLAIRSGCKDLLLNKPDELDRWWFEDWVVTICLCLGHFRMIPEALTQYRQHAGQVTKTDRNLPQGKGESLASQRLRRGWQLQYCEFFRGNAETAVQISDREQSGRLDQIKKAAAFLCKRASLEAVPFYRRVFPVALSLFSGEYHVFASGIRSVAKDLMGRAAVE